LTKQTTCAILLLETEEDDMFVSFETSNIGPFKDRVGISLVADDTKKELLDKNTVFVNEIYYNKTAYIYGSNGAGKTNFFLALGQLQRLLMLSTMIGSNNVNFMQIPALKNEFMSPIETFIFDVNSKNNPTFFKIVVLIDETRYIYTVEVKNGEIIYEELAKKYKRTEVLIKRTSPDYKDIKLKSDFSSFMKNIAVVRKNALCLPMAAMLNHELAGKIMDEIMNIRIINMSALRGVPVFDGDNTDSEALKRYVNILKVAEPTLNDLLVDYKEQQLKSSGENFDDKELIVKNIRVNVESMHDLYDNHNKVDTIKLPFLKYESNGTIRLFGILPAIFKAIDTGGVLFLDEIENGLHPNIVNYIINMFLDESINKRNAQLVCTTHSTHLLNNARRDQVWLVDKNEFGESKITHLSSIKNVRANDNLTTKYLNGVFGGVPNFKY
jgi:hypothetical protein